MITASTFKTAKNKTFNTHSTHQLLDDLHELVALFGSAGELLRHLRQQDQARPDVDVFSVFDLQGGLDHAEEAGVPCLEGA